MSSMSGQNHTSQWQKALLWLGKGSPWHLPPPSRWKSDQPSKMSESPGPLLGGEERTDLLARLHPGDQALWMNVSLRGLVRPQGNIYTKVLPKQKYQTSIENEQNRSVCYQKEWGTLSLFCQWMHILAVTREKSGENYRNLQQEDEREMDYLVTNNQ